MSQFPVNRRGFVCTYPLRVTDQYSTQVVRTPDFTTESFVDLSTPLKRWELRWDAMVDEDYETWHQFIREVGGSGGQFTFIDPSENLLQHTEDFSNAVWLKGTDLVVGKNYLTRSQEIDHSDWIRNEVASVSADSQTAPDNTATAERVTPSGGATNTFVRQQTTAPPDIASAEFVFSVFLKAASGTPTIDIKLAAESPGLTNRATTAAALTTSWQRFSVTGTMGGGDTAVNGIVGGGSSWPVGDGAVDVWGAQLEYGSVASDYTSTTTAAVDLQIADPDFVANPGYPDNLNSATPKRGQVLVNHGAVIPSFRQEVSGLAVTGMQLINSIWIKTPTGTATETLFLEDRTITGGLRNEVFSTAYNATTTWQKFEIGARFSKGNSSSIVEIAIEVAVGKILHVFGPQMEATSIVSAYKKSTSLSALHAKCRFAADSLPRTLTAFNVSQLRKVVIEEFV